MPLRHQTSSQQMPLRVARRRIQLARKSTGISPLLLISQSLTDKQQPCSPTYSHTCSSNAHTYTSTPTQTHMHSTSKHICLLDNCKPLKRASSYSKPRLTREAAKEPFTIYIHRHERCANDPGDDWERSSWYWIQPSCQGDADWEEGKGVCALVY